MKVHGPKASGVADLLEKIPLFKPSQSTIANPHPTLGSYPMTYTSLFMKGIQPNPEKRYQSAEELMQDLEYAMNGGLHASCPVTLAYCISSSITKSLAKKPTMTFRS